MIRFCYNCGTQLYSEDGWRRLDSEVKEATIKHGLYCDAQCCYDAHMDLEAKEW